MSDESYASHATRAEDQTISTVSLNAAGKELKLDPKIVKGAALALGIEMRATGTSLLIDRRDFERIKKRLQPGGTRASVPVPA